MAQQYKNYGISGVNHSLQLGKQGPHIKHNGDGTLSVTDVTGNTLTTLSGANATQSNHLVTKAQLDIVSKTHHKSNLAAVYADANIGDGDLILVDDAGDGEYAIYIANQDNPTSTGHLTLVSTRDSGGADAQTLSAVITHTSGNVTLGNVSSTSRPMSVVVDVTQAFDGNTTITVGDDNNPSRLMGAQYVDVAEIYTYTTNPSYVYTDAVDANNTIKVYVTQGNSTVGTATVLVSYS